jgi:hypothetical protein
MKAIRRIDNLLFLVAQCLTEFKGSQAVARGVNVKLNSLKITAATLTILMVFYTQPIMAG